MANETDPIPAPAGDNIEERYAALRVHLSNAKYHADRSKLLYTAPTCPHAHEKWKYGHTCYAAVVNHALVTLCHECKAMVLSWEARQRSNARDAEQAAEAEKQRGGERDGDAECDEGAGNDGR